MKLKIRELKYLMEKLDKRRKW